MSFRIIVATDYQEMCRKAANIISAQVILNPESVLGLATGSTPLGIYRQLIDWCKKGDVDFSQVKTANLDEYRGIGPENDQSYAYYMFENFFKSINVNPGNTHIPDGKNPNAQEECRRYDELLRSLGGIDLQLLGIGQNGHIGFNEPSDIFEKGTHCVDLTQNTIEANSRFFASIDEVPKQAYTMGIQTIMMADKVLLAANGKAKAEILYQSFYGPVTPKVPASILQMHRDVTVVADEEALAVIKQKGYLSRSL